MSRYLIIRRAFDLTKAARVSVPQLGSRYLPAEAGVARLFSKPLLSRRPPHAGPRQTSPLARCAQDSSSQYRGPRPSRNRSRLSATGTLIRSELPGNRTSQPHQAFPFVPIARMDHGAVFNLRRPSVDRTVRPRMAY